MQTGQSKEEYVAPVVIKHDALTEMTGLMGYHMTQIDPPS